ncbi:histidine--tRNA ligase [Rickettsiales endosymbiont of Peranema trichophorum]|uniref:histidine--tRNA ligase n=1 Tax=Rickettsiales endosymbiont of Peranema trichophorum TaxID=2486577 RepID=UPI001023D30A|nr:histidine--tRNA ligase [Rickettsiales endosymbiont of Peranema trichophorum]RZI45979.1 histidine--tRNA ligase [Rickettsiales endosymbiont of Peranema trichophorum]
MINNISGFPELLPNEQIAFDKVVNITKAVFESYGFTPLETSAVERVDTLLSKGGDHEIYGLYRLADKEGKSKKELALRFDLTVPLSRYIGQNFGHLTFPYRRYQIAPVWRGERPQTGRYRQFYQCDIDIIGHEVLDLAYDAEILKVAYDALKAIGLKNFVININNCNLLLGIMNVVGVPQQTRAYVTRIIDKIKKIPYATFVDELLIRGLSKEQIEQLRGMILEARSNKECISYFKQFAHDEVLKKGLEELQEVLDTAYSFGLPQNVICITPSIARGLNYYTGTIYETISLDHLELGSICGGGRYANLVSTFGNKTCPGVGVSIGLSRLVLELINKGAITSNTQTTAVVLVTVQNRQLLNDYIRITECLRAAGINTELYLSNNSLGAQMKYAAKKSIPFVVIADKAELESNMAILRRMETGGQQTLHIEELAGACSGHGNPIVTQL